MKILIALLVSNIFFSAIAAEKFVSINSDSGFIRIANSFYQVTMFPGHVFPVFWKNNHGISFPGTAFTDCLIDSKTQKIYSLSKDRMAIRKIIHNTPDQCVIEMTGEFCFDNETVAPDKIKAKYQWHFTRESPEIHVSVSLERQSQKTEYILHILEISWNDAIYSLSSKEPGLFPKREIVSEAKDSASKKFFSVVLHAPRGKVIVSKKDKNRSSMRIHTSLPWKEAKYECSGIIILQEK